MNRTNKDVLAMIERLNKSVARNVRDKDLLAYLLQFKRWFELMRCNDNTKWQKDKARFEELKTAIQSEYQRAHRCNNYRIDTSQLDPMINEYLALQRKWNF